MLSKIYLAVLAVSVLVMVFFTYYAWSWLQSIGAPTTAIEGYTYHSGLGSGFLWISWIVLLVLGTAVCWTFRHSWAMWTSLVYFTVFMLASYLWLEPAAFHFKKGAGMAAANFSISPVIGVVSVIAAAVITFAVQFAVVRLRNKMYPAAIPDGDELPADAIDATDVEQ